MQILKSKTREWSVLAAEQQRSSPDGRWGSTLNLIGDKLYLLGGYQSTDQLIRLGLPQRRAHLLSRQQQVEQSAARWPASRSSLQPLSSRIRKEVVQYHREDIPLGRRSQEQTEVRRRPRPGHRDSRPHQSRDRQGQPTPSSTDEPLRSSSHRQQDAHLRRHGRRRPQRHVGVRHLQTLLASTCSLTRETGASDRLSRADSEKVPLSDIDRTGQSGPLRWLRQAVHRHEVLASHSVTCG